MLVSDAPARGFSLIEMMIVVLIVAILTIIGMPSISDWLQNSRTRSVAEALQNGIRYAQTEAARLSRLATIETTASNWKVTFQKLATVDDSVSNQLQFSASGDLANVKITPNAADNAVLQFNNLGRAFHAASTAGPFPALTAPATFLVTNTNGSRKLRVDVSPSGKVRMCDPDKTFSNTYPDGCY